MALAGGLNAARAMNRHKVDDGGATSPRDDMRSNAKVVTIDSDEEEFPELTHYQNFKRKVWYTLDNAKYSKLAQLISIVILFCIFVSIFTFLIVSFPWWYEDPPLYFFIIECIVVGVFTIEYLLRVWTNPLPWPKVGFFIAPLNVIDFLAILPFYIELIGYAIPAIRNGAVGGLAVFRVIRLTRLFRLFKVGRYAQSLQIMGKAMKASLQGLFLLIFFLFLAIVLFSSCLFYAEAMSCNWRRDIDGTGRDGWVYYNKWGGGESPFSSIPATFWWCIVTMTTVGYGDAFPVTPQGKFVASFTMLCGIIIIAFPVAIVSNEFMAVYEGYNESVVDKRINRQREKSSRIRSPLLKTCEMAFNELDELVNKSGRDVLGEMSGRIDEVNKTLQLFQENSFPKVQRDILFPY
eukprot:TRINITY_DN7407_c0_g1_i1.p1 TRINITY_DN7407_c0_g1~~TRINITY_DN7407_c0_g1_i1.p1  ORF type:complete len:426 (+),score=83.91 TRINITY_DN7407_c0_g1_i1:62-1279(+)